MMRYQMLDTAVGDRVKYLRTQQGLSIDTVARVIGVSAQPRSVSTGVREHIAVAKAS
jgi:hypothetical protein